MKERWKPVVGLEGFYEVSDHGRVFSVRSGKILTETDRGGYVETHMCVNYRQMHWLVHVLVAAAFIGPCHEGMEVNHKDLNKANNYWRNLEYMTHKRNCAHARANGHWPDPSAHSHPGELHGMSKLTWAAVDRMRRLHATGNWTQQRLAEEFGVSRGNVSLVVNRKMWTQRPT